jgi:hypothetical protein
VRGGARTVATLLGVVAEPVVRVGERLVAQRVPRMLGGETSHDVEGGGVVHVGAVVRAQLLVHHGERVVREAERGARLDVARGERDDVTLDVEHRAEVGEGARQVALGFVDGAEVAQRVPLLQLPVGARAIAGRHEARGIEVPLEVPERRVERAGVVVHLPHPELRLPELVAPLRPRRVARHEPARLRQRLAERLHRPCRVPLRQPHLPELVERLGAAQQLLVAQLRGRHGSEVRQRARPHVVEDVELPDRLEPPAQVADHEADQLLRLRAPHVGERTRARHTPRLHRAHRRERDERDERRGDEGDERRAPAHQLAEPVGRAGRAGRDRLVAEPALEIDGEPDRRGVAALALGRHRAQDDGVEVAAQLARERPRVAPAPRRPLVARRLARGVPSHAARHGARRRHAPRRRRHVDQAGGEAREEAADPHRGRVARQGAGEELVEEHAQGVDVGARVDVGAPRGGHGAVGLLGAHVGRRADDHPRLRGERLAGEVGVAHRLGDPEVDDLGERRARLLGDEDVGGLEVAVDDPLLMRVLHGVADRGHEPHPLGHPQPALVAPAGDRDAVDVLHRHPRSAGLGGAGIEHAGDPGVLHERERLPLRGEARGDVRGDVGADDLHRDAAADGRRLLGGVDAPHPTLAEDPGDAVRADRLGPAGALGQGARRGGVGERRRVAERRRIEGVAAARGGRRGRRRERRRSARHGRPGDAQRVGGLPAVLEGARHLALWRGARLVRRTRREPRRGWRRGGLVVAESLEHAGMPRVRQRRRSDRRRPPARRTTTSASSRGPKIHAPTLGARREAGRPGGRGRGVAQPIARDAASPCMTPVHRPERLTPTSLPGLRRGPRSGPRNGPRSGPRCGVRRVRPASR